MRTIVLKSFLTSLVLLFFVSISEVQGQYMFLRVNDYGNPGPVSTDHYYIHINYIVQVNQFGIPIVWFNIMTQDQDCSYLYYINNGDYFIVDVSCSDGPTPDIEADVFKVIYDVYRDTYPPSDPPIARGSGESPLQNSDDYYANFYADVDIN